MKKISSSFIALVATMMAYYFLRWIEVPDIGGTMAFAALYLALFARLEQEKAGN